MKPTLSLCDQPKELLDFLNNFSKSPRGFVLFAGKTGSGKTFSAEATMNDCQGYCRLLNISEFYISWLEATRNRESILNVINPFLDADILVIDDIGTRTPSDGFLDFLYLLINKRISYPGGTIVTTNLNSVEMVQKLGHALFSRICSGKIFRFEGKDRRVNIKF